MEDREMPASPQAADWNIPKHGATPGELDDGATLNESPHFHHDMDDDTAEEADLRPSRADIDAAHARMEQEEHDKRRQAIEEKAERLARQERAEREERAEERAKHEAATAQRMTHPHHQLGLIMRDLRSPAAVSGDPATKHAMLHSAVVRLTQLVLSHTPPPQEDENGERIDGSPRREPVEGIDEQEPGILRQQHEAGDQERQQ